jgi:hypothetical protein
MNSSAQFALWIGPIILLILFSLIGNMMNRRRDRDEDYLDYEDYDNNYNDRRNYGRNHRNQPVNIYIGEQRHRRDRYTGGWFSLIMFLLVFGGAAFVLISYTGLGKTTSGFGGRDGTTPAPEERPAVPKQREMDPKLKRMFTPESLND